MDTTWLFYLPLILFFIILVVVNIYGIKRHRERARELAAAQTGPQVYVGQPVQTVSPVVHGEPVYVENIPRVIDTPYPQIDDPSPIMRYK
jgi:hypothetical protein